MIPSVTPSEILLALLLLQVKHLFADWFLQRPFMLRDRARYVHGGRAVHVGLHGAGTLAAFLLVGAGAGPALALAALDLVLHFHIDWAKARHSAARGHTAADAGYWRAMGVDQFAHQATYLALVALWAGWAAG